MPSALPTAFTMAAMGIHEAAEALRIRTLSCIRLEVGTFYV